MNSRTVLSTDWVEVHDSNSTYKARVFLTDEDKAYMVVIRNGKKRLFKIDADLLKFGEVGFFEKVMDNAREISVEDETKHITSE